MTALADSLTLPCGVVLPNRIAKAAMTEGLADERDAATDRHCTLYERWSEGGAGMLLTGNVMVDRRYLERPGNVVVEKSSLDDRGRRALERWARAGTRRGNQLWMQINHPGRQCTRMSSFHPVGPSAIPLQGMLGLTATPRALAAAEIEEIVERWAFAARVAQQTGFTGVQIHAAHGYLCSQFLSPAINRRTDTWGGSLRNRARFLLAVVEAVREAVGDAFPVSVKLNSADFQKGGFAIDESMQVAAWLQEHKLDLLEVSGGTYEQTALFGNLDEDAKKAESTRRREAYFLEYAAQIRKAVPELPIMVTGGFRSAAAMNQALDEGHLDVVGIGRPFCVWPDAGSRLLAQSDLRLPTPEHDQVLGPGPLSRASPFRGVRSLNNLAEVAWFYAQIIELSEGRSPRELTPWDSLRSHLTGELRRAGARGIHS